MITGVAKTDLASVIGAPQVQCGGPEQRPAPSALRPVLPQNCLTSFLFSTVIPLTHLLRNGFVSMTRTRIYSLIEHSFLQ